MDLIAFRVRNFKSIVDSGLIYLSSDYITTIIGENESGKSALIEALDSFYSGIIPEHAVRHNDEDVPSVDCLYQLNKLELEEILIEYDVPDNLYNQLKNDEWQIIIQRIWGSDHAAGVLRLTPKLEGLLTPEESLQPTIGEEEEEEEEEDIVVATKDSTELNVDEKPEDIKRSLTADILVDLLFNKSPTVVFFSKDEHLLPPSIDLQDLIKSQKNKSKVNNKPGASATLNFLQVIGMENLEFFNDRENRAKIQHIIEKKSKEFTDEFRRYWAQKIGPNAIADKDSDEGKIEIKFGVDAHDAGKTEGTDSYLYFIVGDGSQLLHPEQRSDGVRWYISFYLQLRAYELSGVSELEPKPQIILMDEPGRSLHATAQNDLLKLFEEVAKKNTKIVYTTHSPFMVGDEEKIGRIIAAQRSPHIENGGYSHTKVLSGYQLGNASANTLAPMLASMGMRLSDQELIKADHNLITEEISAVFYIKAFLLIMDRTDIEVNLIATSGADNVPKLCYEFLGWQIKFSVLLDGDEKGEYVKKKLMMDLYKGDEELTNKNVHCIRVDGIEDLFSQTDFKKFIINDETINYSGLNSKYVVDAGLSKPALAANFLQKVKDEKLTKNEFLDSTTDNIRPVLNRIKKLIEHQLIQQA